MLDVDLSNHVFPTGAVNRRDFIRVGALTFVGLNLANCLRAGDGKLPAKGKAKAVIQVWLGGGPSHLDTFDPKPYSGADYAGPNNKAVNTNVDGMQLATHFNKLAKIGDKFSLIRGMTHHTNGHETATYLMQTGTNPSPDLVYPSMGAVVAYKKKACGECPEALPPFVNVTSPLGRFSEAGFLGAGYKAFATGGRIEKGELVIGSPNDKKMSDRRSLLNALDAFKSAHDDTYAEMDDCQQQAYNLIVGEGREAFNMAAETPKTRENYGKNKFGQSCLLARRLVEAGVPFVTVNIGGWDTHKKHFERVANLHPQLDQALAALIADLAQRGLLDSTVVLCGGEFGRTPKILYEPPWNGGRSHFCHAFSYLVAGGGLQGGHVIGKTDSKGERVVERPVYPWDLSATIYRLLGIDPRGSLPHPRGCVAYVTPPTDGSLPSGGELTELI